MSQILIVDDEEPIREVLIEFLAGHGYSALGVESGARALEEARALRPQVILLDVAMPGMNGIETLQRLREESDEPAIIMISGHADSEMAARALDLGAYDFIQKPLDFKYLEQTLLAKIVTIEGGGSHGSRKGHRHGSTHRTRR